MSRSGWSMDVSVGLMSMCTIPSVLGPALYKSQGSGLSSRHEWSYLSVLLTVDLTGCFKFFPCLHCEDEL